MTLKTKFLILLIAFTLIPIVLFGGVAYEQARDILQSVRIAELNALADLKKDKIETFFIERGLDISAIQNIRVIQANLPVMSALRDPRHLLSVKAEADLDSRLVHLMETHGYLDIMLMDKQGRIVYICNKSHATQFGRRLAGLGTFEAAKQAIVFSDIIIPGASGDPIEIIGAGPIRNQRGEFIGVAAIEIDMGPVYRTILNNPGLGRTGEALIVRKEGDSVLFLSPLRDVPDAALKKKAAFTDAVAYPAQKAALGETGSGVTLDYSGKDVLAAWRFLPHLRWGLVTKIDANEAFAPASRLRTIMLSIEAVMAILCVIAALTVSGTITRPLRSLQHGAAAVAEGNLDHRVGTGSNDEIGVLSRDFDRMTEALALDRAARIRSEEEVKALNEELRHNVRQLEESNKELDAFSYSVSHDLRSPLRSIDGFGLALMEDYGDKLDDKGRDYLERIRNATHRMSRLIDDLLNLSRMARFEMKREPVDLSAIARGIAANLGKSRPERRAEFIVADGLSAYGDGHLLAVVLENLLSNAWKFSEKTPRTVIEFGAVLHNNETTYFVKDNGAGFDMAYADKLFTPFQRLHRDAEFAGTGVGLATVKRIINRHGGKIRIEGEPGKGATVYFTLS